MPERTDSDGAPGARPAPVRDAGGGTRTSLRTGPGRLLVTLYTVFVIGATSRSAYQIATRFDQAPLPYTLSAVAAVVYVCITVALVRGGEAARRTALAGCVAELLGVLVVGTWSVLDPAAFPDTTVWSAYGMGYLFIPLLLPVLGLWWLRSRPSGR